MRGRASRVVGVDLGLSHNLINALLGIGWLMPVRAATTCAR